MASYLYVSLAGEDKILHFDQDRNTGRLRLLNEIEAKGAPGPLALNPKENYLYAGLRAERRVVTYRIDERGALNRQSTLQLESDPCFLETDRIGRFLLSAYYSAGVVGVHRISEDGYPSPTPSEWIKTAEKAHSIQTDPTNRFAFVPHTGPNVILQFLFDETTGRLRPNDPFRVEPEEGAGPRHFCFHPDLPVIYVSNELGSSVAAYRLNRETGKLSALQSLSTLPDSYRGENTCAQIHINPAGTSLYVSNRGHDSIACFSIEPETGRLESIGQVAAEKTPRAFNLDTEGRFLYVAGRDSGRMGIYRIDTRSGALAAEETLHVGESPMWILPMVR